MKNLRVCMRVAVIEAYPQGDGVFPEGSVHAYRPPCAPQVTPAPKVPVALLHQGPPRLLQDVNDILSALWRNLSCPTVLTCTKHT